MGGTTESFFSAAFKLACAVVVVVVVSVFCSVSFHCQKLLKFDLSCSLRLLTRAQLCSRALLRRSRCRCRRRKRCCFAVAATHCAFNSPTELSRLSVSFRS